MVRARECDRYLTCLSPEVFFFIESSPGGLIFGFLLLFLLENLEPIQLREKEPFHQVRPDVPEVIGDPYGRDITNTTHLY